MFEFYYDTELYHHGIKGQKWGVRRYQNFDGSLTEAGRQRYEQILERNGRTDYTQVNRQIERAGIRFGANGTDTLRKGTIVNRMSSSRNEKIDGHRKYVSLTDYDKKLYRDIGKSGGIGGERKSYETQYEITKDAKIASAKKVADVFMKQYGNIKIGDLSKRYTRAIDFSNRDLKYKTIGEIYSDILKNDLREHANTIDRYGFESAVRNGQVSKKDIKLVRAVTRRTEIGKTLINGAMNTFLYEEPSEKIFNEFRKAGYDAIVDTQDYGRLSQYPLIFLSPKNTMIKKK